MGDPRSIDSVSTYKFMLLVIVITWIDIGNEREIISLCQSIATKRKQLHNYCNQQNNKNTVTEICLMRPVLAHKTSSTPTVFIEVPVQSQENHRSCRIPLMARCTCDRSVVFSVYSGSSTKKEGPPRYSRNIVEP